LLGIAEESDEVDESEDSDEGLERVEKKRNFLRKGQGHMAG